jgi:hypothetical protein
MDNACAPTAWAIVTGLPFEQVFEELQSYQPKEKIERVGTCNSSSWRFAKRHGYQFVQHKALYHRGQCRMVNQLLKACDLPKDPVVAIVYGHAVAVVNHVVYDSWDSRGQRSRKLHGYFIKRG